MVPTHISTPELIFKAIDARADFVNGAGLEGTNTPRNEFGILYFTQDSKELFQRRLKDGDLAYVVYQNSNPLLWVLNSGEVEYPVFVSPYADTGWPRRITETYVKVYTVTWTVEGLTYHASFDTPAKRQEKALDLLDQGTENVSYIEG